jgi:hypothetical protein
MKTVLISIFSGTLMLGVALAQDNPAPPPASPSPEPRTSTPAQPPAQPQTAEPATQPVPPQSSEGVASSTPSAPARIAPGSVLPVSLTKTIDAKKAKTGDEVVAQVTQDLKNNTGDVIVAKDTKVVGHVTEAQARSKEQKESEVGIAFDHAILKNGGEMQMPMSIQAIIGPQNNQSNTSAGPGAEPRAGAAGNSGTGRAGGMGGSTPPPSPSPTTGGNVPSDAQTGTNQRPPITAKTEGVVGISDLKLTTEATQGSVVSSEKNNVKLESGTVMLLRVNQ